MKTIRSKVVLVGQPGVGKTSLVRRFVSDEFTERHIQTIGVRVEKRTVSLPDVSVELMVWDIAGPEAGQKLQTAYLAGASAVLLVGDLASAASCQALETLAALGREYRSDVPLIVLANKVDLEPAPGSREALAQVGATSTYDTSARTGGGVAEAFEGTAALIASKV